MTTEDLAVRAPARTAPMKWRTHGRSGGAAALAMAVALLASGCAAAGLSFLDPQGPVAVAQRAHLLKMTAITLVVVLPVLVLVPLLAWRYRYKNKRAPYTPDWEYSGPLELAMWGVPVIIVVLLATQLWRNTIALDPYAPVAPGRPVLVQVVGLDWKWLFIYPELGIATIGELGVPAGTPLALRLTSDTVMQSFIVSALGSQIYAMPGMTTQLNLLARQPGEYLGRNTQYNGTGFQDQKFVVRSFAATEFEAWVGAVRAHGLALDESRYARLAIPSTPLQTAQALGTANMPPGVVHFNTVAPGLFDSIVHKYMSGQPVTPPDQAKAPAVQPGGKP